MSDLIRALDAEAERLAAELGRLRREHKMVFERIEPLESAMVAVGKRLDAVMDAAKALRSEMDS